ncbi:CD225/dispanin family protein [Marinitenerispora sediminis]|uniref:Uncharacterized protein n=1 Tax=Marinitenerispora sediminis TaxID=1931232 RepID=A0A368T6B8_9ACTN|nr:CD225/dispanin family protein [Marinitenerispora sediminis]RCV54874.1 hypothetical protein DEF28_07215 [Marinitenerispora sediminis]RCV59263.1 hypothetical protein DEF24_10345 [Marinitenerispora sediminis]RCV60275.1 hypothetical protein DEF23_05130 [Marinitenerispora sediminis]
MSNPSLPPGASAPRDDQPGRGRGRRSSAPGRGEDPERGRDAGPARGSGGASSSTMALILHALTFLCCANWLFGVIGISFAVRAAHRRDRGDYEQAETFTRYSWYCLGAAGVMFAVMAILFGVLLTQAGSWVDSIAPVTNY